MNVIRILLVVKLLNGLNWLRIGPMVGMFGYGNGLTSYIKKINSTELVGSSGSASHLHSGDNLFESRPGH
jgi:hypothetical protein